MNPASTDTRIYRPAEVISKLGVQQNDGGKNYVARHSTETRAEFTPGVGRHHVDDSLTRIIPPVQLQALVPLPSRPPAPMAESPTAATSAIEPPAEVTVGLLERVKAALRRLT
jgi:hypothetical protein